MQLFFYSPAKYFVIYYDGIRAKSLRANVTSGAGRKLENFQSAINASSQPSGD